MKPITAMNPALFVAYMHGWSMKKVRRKGRQWMRALREKAKPKSHIQAQFNYCEERVPIGEVMT